MPRACPVESPRSLLFSWEREPPRDKPVASSFVVGRLGVATSVRTATGQARGIFNFELLGPIEHSRRAALAPSCHPASQLPS